MKLTKKDLDALNNQLVLLYKDLPDAFHPTPEPDVKTGAGQNAVLTCMEKQFLLNSESPARLTVLKFAVLSMLHDLLQPQQKKALSPDGILHPILESAIERALKEKYPNIFTALFNSRKSAMGILAEHRNAASRLFCQAGQARSFSLFSRMIIKSTQGTALFTPHEQTDDEDYTPYRLP